jgi:uncharacterized protein (TIRG00374 family)
VWRLALAVAISLALLAWAVSGVHLEEFLEHVKGARIGPLLLAVIIATLVFPARLFRWRLLLRRPDGGPFSYRALWHAVAIGFAANNLLPFRAGELLRTYAISRLAPTRLTSALSSIAVERVFDSLAVVLLLTIALFLPGMPADVSISGVSIARAAMIAGVASGLALVVAGLVVAFPLVAERAVRRLIRAERFADKIINVIEGLREGMSALNNPARFLGVALWSLGIWLLNALAFYVGFAVFDIPVNYAGALLLQGVLVFGIAVPLAPGFVGAFEAVIRAVLSIYGITPGQSLSFALTYHVATFLPITLLGLWSFMVTGMRLGQLSKGPPSGD